jgi:hypothetical protein
VAARVVGGDVELVVVKRVSERDDVLVVGCPRESVGDDHGRARCAVHVTMASEQFDLVRGDEQGR